MPPPRLWTWDQAVRRYRNPATGRFVSTQTMIGLRDQFIDLQKERVASLTQQMVDRKLTRVEWELAMRNEIRISHIDMYVMGHGGRNNMTQRDWGILGRELRDQYGYLQRFAEDVSAGKLSPAQARVRSQMYIGSATQSYERGLAEAWGLPRLPQYPADGQTICRANCQCHLEYEDADNAVHVFWVLGQAEHCEDCVALADEWSPLEVAKTA